MKSPSTIALFTTMPASEMTPTPVMIRPNGVPVRMRPHSTPMSDSTTDTITVIGSTRLLNCVTSTSAMSSTAMTKARWRNACASSCSWLAPPNSQR
jgi:hypothetical protein